MRAPVKTALVLAALGAALAYTRWPHINDVETGRTPEYPDLRIQSYGATEERVTRAARAAVTALPGWDLIGSGRGPGGSELQAVARTRVLRFKDDVTVKVRRREGASEVRVRSRARIGRADFGQNARNIRAFQAEMERQMLQP
jgi:uncharacterized protein (DUF1499 family)